MKRFLVLACATLLFGVSAFAGTVFIPWLQDNGGAVGPDIVPPDGEATYVKLQNVTGGPIDVTITWFDGTGPIHVNTHTLAPAGLLAWRPHGWQGLLPDGGGAVSATVFSGIVSWTSGTNADIVGNLITINTNGSRLGMNLVMP